MTGLARTTGPGFWQLPPAELKRLLVLAEHADRVELKLVVPAVAHAFTCATFGADLTRAGTRKVYFLDTPDLQLERHGVVARLRSTGHEPGDSVIKLRPVRPGDLPARLRRARRFTVEVDAMPDRFVCTAAIRRRLGTYDVQRTITEGGPLRELFSRAQRELLVAHAPAQVGIDDLVVLGPVEVRRSKVFPAGLGGVLTVEQWAYPNGSRILELSTRCAARHTLPAAERMASVLRAHRIAVTGPQQTKTRTTLAYFGSLGRRTRVVTVADVEPAVGLPW